MRLFIAAVIITFGFDLCFAGEQIDLSFQPDSIDKLRKVSHILYEARELHLSQSLAAADIRQSCDARVIGDSVQVRVLLKQEATSSLLDLLRTSGGRIQRSHGRSVQMIVPLNSLDWFETQYEVAAVYRPNYATIEEVISEGLDTLGIPAFHSVGYQGQGVKIAVIDVGFDGYSQYIGTELPSDFHGVYFGSDFGGTPSTKHGTRCSQIVHDVAPQAEIWMLQVDTDLDFIDACNWVQNRDFDVVSVSLAFLNSGWLDGSSSISSKVNRLHEKRVLYVNAAANYAQAHWSGPFVDSDEDGVHEFAVSDNGNSVYLMAGIPISIYLSWNDWAQSDNDYDLYLVKSSTNEIVDRSIDVQSGYQEPVEYIYFVPASTGIYYMVITNYSASGLHRFHLFIPGYDGLIQYTTPSISVPPPADAAGALTVGAVPWYSPHTIQSYSSRGPTEDYRIKPELVAPDEVSVKEGLGTVEFPGTSASCPHVAGAAAVYLSYKPLVVPSTVIDSFKTMCIDLGNSGPDNTYGWGLLHLPPPDVNHSPYIMPLSDRLIYEEQTLSFYVVAFDPDNDPLTYQATSLPPGATFNPTTHLFSWTPTTEQSGYYPNVTFRVSDGELSDSETMNITVLDKNRPPVLEDLIDKQVNENQMLMFTVVATDPDQGDVVSYWAKNLPAGASFSTNTGSFLWIPTYEQAGLYPNVVFGATDSKDSVSDAISITVLDVNRPPVLSNVTDKEVLENQLLSFTITATDPDQGDVVSYWTENLPMGAVFSSNTGSFAWIPSYEQAGLYSGIIFGATDSQDSVWKSISITVINVNRAPSSFSLISPPDGDTVESNSAELTWHRSIDPDPEDDVSYLLQYSMVSQAGKRSLRSDMAQSIIADAVVAPPPYPPGIDCAANSMFRSADYRACALQADTIRFEFDATTEGWDFYYAFDSVVVVYVCPGTDCESWCSELLKTTMPFDLGWSHFQQFTTLRLGGHYQGYWNGECDYEFWEKFIWPHAGANWRGTERLEARIFNSSEHDIWAAFACLKANDTVWTYYGDNSGWTELAQNSWTLMYLDEPTEGEFHDLDNILINFGAYDWEGNIYVDWVRAMKSDNIWDNEISGIQDTQYTIGSLNERSIYYWKILAVDNYDTATHCASAFSFLAGDVTAPSFIVNMLPNPVLPFELDILAFPSESLISSPSLDITSTSGTETVNMIQLGNREALTYASDYQVLRSDVYTLSICGTDDFGNHGCSETSFSAAPIHADQNTLLISPSGAYRVSIPPHSCTRDNLLLCFEGPTESDDLSSVNMPENFTPVSVFKIKAGVSSLRSSITFTVNLDQVDLQRDGSQAAVLMRLEGDTLMPIQVRHDPSRNELIAEISQFGTFLLGKSSGTGGDFVEDGTVPDVYLLNQNWPNPFNAGTMVSFELPRPARVKLVIYNILGRAVVTLVDRHLTSGSHSAFWDGTDRDGNSCSSGIYFYRIQAKSFTATKRMLLLK